MNFYTIKDNTKLTVPHKFKCRRTHNYYLKSAFISFFRNICFTSLNLGTILPFIQQTLLVGLLSALLSISDIYFYWYKKDDLCIYEFLILCTLESVNKSAFSSVKYCRTPLLNFVTSHHLKSKLLHLTISHSFSKIKCNAVIHVLTCMYIFPLFT